MKRNQVNSIFEDEYRRKKFIIGFVSVIIVLFIVSIISLCLFIKGNRVQYASYQEKSNIDYKVFLKESDFFDNDFLDSDRQYISSLIDYIGANFKYNLYLDNSNVTYKYSYRIEGNVVVKNKGGSKKLYDSTDILLPTVTETSSERSLTFNEYIEIDYNQYNSMIKKFVSTYDLADTESYLYVNMYVSVIGTCEDFDSMSTNESVMTITIPLNKNNFGIDLSNDLLSTDDDVMICSKPSAGIYIYLVICMMFIAGALIFMYKLVEYCNNTRTALSIYQKELKRILGNYSSYIQKVDGTFNLRGYQVLRIEEFSDMLEIRDTLQQPILMVENGRGNGVFFIIPSNTKILYVYGLKLSDIEKELSKEREEEF